MKSIHQKYVLLFILGVLFSCGCFGVFFLGRAIQPTFSQSEKLIEKEVELTTQSEQNVYQNKQVTTQEGGILQNKQETVQEEDNLNNYHKQNENSIPETESLKKTEPILSSSTPQGEEMVVNFFSEQQQAVNRGTESDSNLMTKIKTGFTNMYQFLFQGGTIKGYTFSDLTTKTKLQVLKIALSIDHKINEIFPNYKENIKSGTSNLKIKAITKYLEVTAKICENHDDTCTQAREDFHKMKESFGYTFSMIKDFIKEGSSAFQEWYKS